MQKKVFIGVAWPYVNGNLHIGHLAGYLLPTDICARYNRIIGNDVLMVSGSDCHGTPITVEADKRGVKPQDIVDEYHAKDVDLFLNVLGITYDLYTRTDHPNHKQVTQDIFVKMLEEGYILIKREDQFFDPSTDKFLPDRYVIGKCPFCGLDDSRSDQCDNCGKLIAQEELINPKSNLTKEPVKLKETEHYYIDWPKLQPKIEKYVDSVSDEWKNWVAQETKGWLKEGLQPRAITRDIDWGVEIPADRIPKDKLIENYQDKRFYVWFDAVIGYYSASLLWAKENNKSWEDFWFDSPDYELKHYYFMGKDNLPFHAMFWPGKLMIYNPKLHLPDVVSINQFYNLEGKQFSKSRGHVIDTKELVETYGNDRVRFYVTLTMPETKDSSFSWSDFEEKVNGILVANLGNFIHRTLSLGFNADSQKFSEATINADVIDRISKAFENSRKYLENCEFRNYLEEITKLSSYGNKYLDDYKLWELKKQDEDAFLVVLKQLYAIIYALNYLITPLLPDASKNLANQLGVEEVGLWPNKVSSSFFEKVSEINLTHKPVALFEKIDLSNKN